MNRDKDNFKNIFNMNNILNKVVSYGAYLILLASVLILVYLSFVDTFNVALDFRVLGIFSGATVMLSWTCWNIFYRKQYEKVMSDDINQNSNGKYSIHYRYYNATKDWSDIELQKAIDKFNDEYIAKWLRYVEKRTGVPIESGKMIIKNEKDEEEIIDVVGIKDRPYKGFKHKILMWRIKNHKYPESGYKTSMELLSLFSFQDANFNKRDLRADKSFYRSGSIKKLIVSILIVVSGASFIPEMVKGDYFSIIMKLILAIWSLLSAVFMGAMNGVKGARIKLSIVEDACVDLERWKDTKPIIAPYESPIKIENESDIIEEKEVKEDNNSEQDINFEIFKQNM